MNKMFTDKVEPILKCYFLLIHIYAYSVLKDSYRVYCKTKIKHLLSGTFFFCVNTTKFMFLIYNTEECSDLGRIYIDCDCNIAERK
jgi:hypothetical protein